jgi:phosphopantetheinyl transferase
VLSDLATWHEEGSSRIVVLDTRDLAESLFSPFLTPADHRETQRIRPPLGRRAAMASRALTRAIWARRLHVSPLEVPVRRRCTRCGSEQHGRPYLEHPDTPDFSISHSDALVVFAETDEGSVGVDIESLRTLQGVDTLITSTLTAREVRHVLVGAGPTSHRYLEVWTRKEAMLKLAGEGLWRRLTGVDSLTDPVVLEGFPEVITLSRITLPEGHVGHLAHSEAPPFPRAQD